jgi:hypothetical protein
LIADHAGSEDKHFIHYSDRSNHQLTNAGNENPGVKCIAIIDVTFVALGPDDE